MLPWKLAKNSLFLNIFIYASAYLQRLYFWSFKTFKLFLLFVAQSCTHTDAHNHRVIIISLRIEKCRLHDGSLGRRWWCMLMSANIFKWSWNRSDVTHTTAVGSVCGSKDISRCSLLDVLITDEITSEETEYTWKHLKTYVHFKVQKNCTPPKCCRFIRSRRCKLGCMAIWPYNLMTVAEFYFILLKKSKKDIFLFFNAF